jgi:hypothetical protein
LDYIPKIGFERIAPPARRQPPAAERELMPHRRRDCALMTVPAEPLDDLRVRDLGDRSATMLVSSR